MLRSLYLASYLRRPYAEYALTLLTESEHVNWLRAGVPTDVVVANKIGEDAVSGQYHDCAIVYHPKRPYILCVMSRNSTAANAAYYLPLISKTVYDAVSLPPAHLR